MNQLKRIYSIATGENYKPSECVASFDKLVKILRTILKACGMDVIQKNFKLTFVSWSTIAVMIFSCILTVYTAIYFYPNWYKIMECFAVSFIGIQGFAKAEAGLKKDTNYFHDTYGVLRNYYVKSFNNTRQNKAMSLCVDRALLLYQFLMFAYFSAAIGFILSVVYYYVVKHERILIITIYIPYLDPSTDFGYFCTVSIHLFMLYIALSGMLCSDGCFLILVVHITGLGDWFTVLLTELNEELDNPKHDKAKVKEMVRNICTEFTELRR